MSTRQIVAINQWGFRAQFDDNPRLKDPGVRFFEEKFVSWEQEFGNEGSEASFREGFERWSTANGF